MTVKAAIKAALIPGLMVASIAALGVMSFAPPLVAAEDRVEMSFYSLKTDKLLYRGKRTTTLKDDQVTELSTFTTPAGKPIQELKSVFGAADLAPISYSLRDLRSGQVEVLRREKGGFFMSYTKNKGAAPDEDTEKPRPHSLISATVVPTIHKEWKTLLKGKKVAFRLLVPSRQESISFRVQLDEDRTAADKTRTVIRMDPDSWIIRRLVSPIFFFFETKVPHRMLEFQGRVSIKTKNGDDQDLKITYHYLKENQ